MSDACMSDQWDRHYAADAGARWWPNTELVSWISGRQFEHAVDVGAGTGSNVQLLQCHADRVLAVEPNETARHRLQERFYGGIRPMLERMPPTISGDSIADLPDWPSEQADLIVDCMTSQHIPWAEHEPTYREYARILKPGGWLWLYHLDSDTAAIRTRVPGTVMAGEGVPDDWVQPVRPYDVTGLSLFPTLDLFCLPPTVELALAVGAAGLKPDEIRGLKRIYPNGEIASYTIIAAKRTPKTPGRRGKAWRMIWAEIAAAIRRDFRDDVDAEEITEWTLKTRKPE